MAKSMLSGENLPFCPGCSHGPTVKFLSKALEECGYSPLDIVMVSDIGCTGLVDPLFNTHTIHGLHGRSPALAMGVALGLSDPAKKVISIQGDGGATIGLQHILEAARRNLNLTLVLLNNLVYGMTGGQVSGLSSNEFKNEKAIPDDAPPFDICQLAHDAGAAKVIRVNNPKEITSALVKALKTDGFSLVEISSLCQAYGAKKVDELIRFTREPVELARKRKAAKHHSLEKASLITEEMHLIPKFESSLDKQIGILIAGSAGGGVQSAAKLLAHAGILSGLRSTMKGEYPITVGTGFSVAEVILSRSEINYTGLEEPDVIIIVSESGYKKVKSRISVASDLYIDMSVEADDVSIKGKVDFAKKGGKKGAALSAITYWLEKSQIISTDALREATLPSKHSKDLLKIIDQSGRLVLG